MIIQDVGNVSSMHIHHGWVANYVGTRTETTILVRWWVEDKRVGFFGLISTKGNNNNNNKFQSGTLVTKNKMLLK